MKAAKTCAMMVRMEPLGGFERQTSSKRRSLAPPIVRQRANGFAAGPIATAAFSVPMESERGKL